MKAWISFTLMLSGCSLTNAAVPLPDPPKKHQKLEQHASRIVLVQRELEFANV